MTDDRTLPLHDRAILAAAGRRPLEAQARRALLSACEDLTLCALVALGRLRGEPDPHGALLARVKATQMRCREAEDRAEILTKRLELEPSAAAMAALLTRAIARVGRPKHLVSDQGTQFTAAAFRDSLEHHGIRQRFGALGQHGSIALIERFFKTLKNDLSLCSLRPWVRRDFERRLHAALVRYAFHRPHSALEGRPPAEVYFGISDQAPLLNWAPRGRIGDTPRDCPFLIALLDPESLTLPILLPKAA